MRRLLALSSLALLVVPAPAQVAPALAPPQRADILERVQKLLEPQSPTVPVDLKDPFHSTAFREAVGAAGVAGPVANAGGPGAAPARPAGPRGHSELLAAIAEGLRPSGYIVRGGTASIAFGQKRVKAGDTLTINFEGVDYVLEITALDRTHFTIRLGNEEFTRPIR